MCGSVRMGVCPLSLWVAQRPCRIFGQPELIAIEGETVRPASEQRKQRWCGQMSALLLIFSLLLPFAQFSFGSSENTDAALPACCRTHGKHKCSMRMFMRTERQSQQTPSSPQIAQVTEKCPYTPGLALSAHSNPLWNQPNGLVLVHDEDRRAPTGVSRIERPSSTGRANPKRGPPSFSETA